MKLLYNGVLLYHGSYCAVTSPDLSECREAKDFGRGFYLTTSKEQAVKFIATSLKKAKSAGIIEETQNYGAVSTFRYVGNKDLNIYNYDGASINWLQCIVGHRDGNVFQDVVQMLKKYDIITGKIANDNTNFTIAAYLAGAYGTVDSVEAANDCIGRLIPERLKDQLCFRTELALKSLSFAGSEQIWMK
jgi:hypothetical protein